MKLRKTRLNLALALVVIVLSLLTVYWHHQLYLLFKQHRQIDVESTRLIALNKQLRTDQSQRLSGAQIKHKALDELKMRAPKPTEYRQVEL